MAKNGKCNQYNFLQVFPKSSWTNFKTILETLSDVRACHVKVIGGVAYKHPLFLRFFENILASF